MKNSIRIRQHFFDRLCTSFYPSPKPQPLRRSFYTASSYSYSDFFKTCQELKANVSQRRGGHCGLRLLRPAVRNLFGEHCTLRVKNTCLRIVRSLFARIRYGMNGSSPMKFVPMWHKVGKLPPSPPGASSSSAPRLRVVSWNVLADGDTGALSCKHDYCPLDLRIWKTGGEQLQGSSKSASTKKADHGTVPTTSEETEDKTTTAKGAAILGSTSTSGPSRLLRTVDRIRELNADILCLQECPRDFFDDFETALAEEYKGYHVGDCLPKDLRWAVGRPQNLDNAIFIRSAIMVDSTSKSADAKRKSTDLRIQVEAVKGTLFRERLKIQMDHDKNSKKGGPLLTGVVSGKTKKRIQTLEESCMWMRLVVNDKFYLVLGNTHLFWDPRYPQVKAYQAETFVNLCAADAEAWVQERTQVKSGNEISGPAGEKDEKVCFIFCGDWNTIPNFQAEFCAEDEVAKLRSDKSTLAKLYVTDARKPFSTEVPLPVGKSDEDERHVGNELSIEKTAQAFTPPKRPQKLHDSQPERSGTTETKATEASPEKTQLQTKEDLPELESVENLTAHIFSGAFQLLATGSLPPFHPEHPDSFGKPPAQENCKKPQPVLGEMRTQLGALHNAYCGRSFFPTLTTKVSGFEGCLDYVFYTTRAYHVPAAEADASVSDDVGELAAKKSRRIGAPLLFKEALLDVPQSEELIPNAKHTSDHYPLGVIFRFLEANAAQDS
ncbi:unnamed protein product [Amoebophrya sp. A120]|nr:unnamed protein product [Amoebophrya sp. A120]|eukprot:GSA120T00002128001.1